MVKYNICKYIRVKSFSSIKHFVLIFFQFHQFKNARVSLFESVGTYELSELNQFGTEDTRLDCTLPLLITCLFS